MTDPQLAALVATLSSTVGAIGGWFAHAKKANGSANDLSHELSRARHEEILRGLQGVVRSLDASVGTMTVIATELRTFRDSATPMLAAWATGWKLVEDLHAGRAPGRRAR